MKKGKNILKIVVIVLVVFALTKNFVIKAGAELGTRVVTGNPLKMEKFKLGIISSLVDIKGIQLKNSGKFKKDPVMVDIPEIYVDYELMPIFTGNVKVKDVKFHLKNFVFVKHADGSTNLDNFLKKKEKKAEKDKKKKDSGKSDKKTKFQLDNLSLKIDKVTIIEYNEAGEASVKEINVNLDENHQDIKSLAAVSTLIFVKIATKTAIGSLVSVDLGMLQDSLGGAVGAAKETAGKVLGEASGQLNKATDGLKGLLKNPLGDK